MIERIIILEHADPAIFFGTNNANIQLIKSLFPKLRIVARGNAIKASGSAEEMPLFEEKLNELEQFCLQTNRLSEDDIVALVKGNSNGISKQDNLIIFGISGKPIVARTANQEKIVKQFEKNDLLFGVGPAGSGKTYTAIALAVRAFKNKEVRKIILCRPAVEAGEKLGFLPGDLTQKVDPYLRPLYDALYEMLGFETVLKLIERNVIEIAPLAFMRGRTLNDAFIILDEAQNTTVEQMKMFLTRLGFNSTAVITGDVSQIDLPKHVQSGLKNAMTVLNNVDGITMTFFDSKDVVRHPLVAKIINAYQAAEDSKND